MAIRWLCVRVHDEYKTMYQNISTEMATAIFLPKTRMKLAANTKQSPLHHYITHSITTYVQKKQCNSI